MNILFAFGKYLKQKKNKANNKMTRFDKRMRQNQTVPCVSKGGKMIYTITFNPALDYVIKSKEFNTGKINKSQEEYIFPGGKGINVSIVLKTLGQETTAMGFIAGFVGNEIEKQVQK